MAKIDLETVQPEMFQPHVNAKFVMEWDGQTTDAVLESVDELPVHSRPGEEPKRKKPFAMIFKCSAEYVAQGQYDFDHPEAGSISLFVSPVDSEKNDEGTWCYVEAVIN